MTDIPRRGRGRPPKAVPAWKAGAVTQFHEPGQLRCERCELLNHTAENCDLRGAAYNFTTRRHAVDIE